MTFRNNGRAIECLGTVGAAEMVIGRFECEITATIYVVDAVSEVMDAFLNNEEIGFGFIAATRSPTPTRSTSRAAECRALSRSRVAPIRTW